MNRRALRERPAGPRRRSGPLGPERGAGTMVTLAVSLVIAAVALAAALLGQAVAVGHRAQTAADLMALAAAQARVSGGDGCREAAALAARNRATLVRCEPRGSDVYVRAGVRLGWRIPGAPELMIADAQAGPR